VVRANAFRIGAPIYGKEGRYDLVFVDPPYARTREAGAESPLAQLFNVLKEQVTEAGMAVVRTERGVTLLDSYGVFEAIDRRDWGTMTLVLYQVQSDDE
jgi:16S rRNA G966 N2-methylase RsmD